MKMYEKFLDFETLLHDTNPDATSNALTIARNAFLYKYGGYAVAPEISLAVAVENELLRIRNAGKKCQKIYANAQTAVRLKLLKPVMDILDLKKEIYSVIEDKDKYIFGVDRMVLQCIEYGIRDIESFDLLMPEMLTNGQHWDGDEKILGKAWVKITQQRHPEIKNPHAYIVIYAEKHCQITYVGTDPLNGRKELMRRLADKGYSTNVSGKINGLPIHFINAEKKEEEPHGET